MRTTDYEKMGGDIKVKALAKAFYHHMNTDSAFAGIRKLHSNNLEQIEQVFVEFLTGWLGGPQLYMEKYGHPRLRQRHAPFSIGISERDQWLQCMDKALTDIELEPTLKASLTAAFVKTADFLRNREEGVPISQPFMTIS